MKKRERIFLSLTKVFLVFALACLFISCPGNGGKGNGGTNSGGNGSSVSSEPVYVEFDTSLMTCHKKNDKTDSILSGKTVLHEKDKIVFVSTPSTGKTPAQWLLNGKVSKYSTYSTFTYTVNLKNSIVKDGKNVIVVSYTPRDLQKIKIVFDETKMTCEKSLSETVKTGDFVDEDDFLTFEAILPPKKIVDYWSTNGEKDKYSEEEDSYSLSCFLFDAKLVDGVHVIEVDYTIKPPQKVKIIFDETKMSCSKGHYMNGDSIKTNTVLDENDEIRFQANPPTGTRADKWFVNDVEQPKYIDENDTFDYTVEPNEAVDGSGGEKIVKIHYNTRDIEIIIIKFDETKIKCTEGLFGGGPVVTSGKSFEEGEEIEFEAILNPGESVQNWYANEEQCGLDSTKNSYTINRKDAKIVDGKKVIEITYTLE